MTTSTVEDLEREFASLLADVQAWDGLQASAAPLRVRAASMGEIQRKGKTEAERGLLAILAGYRKKKPGRVLVDPDQYPEAARIHGPFLGDPAMGEWPWHAPLVISEDDAISWLPLVGRHAAADDPRVLEFVMLIFHARKRSAWVPASSALAALAARHEAPLAALTRQWEVDFPDGLPTAWPPLGLVVSPKGSAALEATAADAVRHRARHVLHAMSAFAAAGGDISRLRGAAPERLPAMALPKDDSDASAVLLALRVLLSGEKTRAATLASLPARVAEVGADEQGEAVLRHIADDLRAPEVGAVRQHVERRLREARWKGRKQAKRFDALWSWLESAAWFRLAGDETSVAAMAAEAAEASAAFRLKLDGALPNGARDPVDAVLGPLRAVLDVDVFETTPDPERAVQLTELLLLLDHPQIAGLPWRRLGVRAAGATAASRLRDGDVGVVARADLAVLLAERKFAPALLLRDARLSQDDVRTLAALPEEFSGQVAVQLERLLREDVRDAPDQVRLLWRTLQRRPPTKTYRELLTTLRGSGGPLHGVTAAVAALDALRKDKVPMGELAAGYGKLASRVLELLESTSASASGSTELAGRIQRMAAALERAGQAAQGGVGSAAWCAALHDLLLGDASGNDGIDGWMAWLGTPIPGLSATWARFEACARIVREAAAAVSRTECEELATAAASLRALLGGLAWPEAEIVHGALESAVVWQRERAAVAQRGAWERERVRQVLARGDEKDLTAALDGDGWGGTLACLTPEDVRRLCRFLLSRFLFGHAHRLRTSVRDRVQLPAVWAYMAPLLLGVMGGTFVVLSMPAWNEVVAPGHALAFRVVFVLGLVFSFLILVGSLARRMAASELGGRRLRALGSVCWRVLPLYVGCLALATAVSASCLWSLDGTTMRADGQGQALPFWPQLALWSSLSLFLGIFVGLVLQGRGVAVDD